MSYERNDMYYKDYSWKQREQEIQVKAMERFQPHDGDMVLGVINSLTSNLFDSTILEIIIREFIPNTINTVKQAYDWIKKKGDYYYEAILRSVSKSD